MSHIKGAELGHILLLNTNKKSYVGSAAALSTLTLGDLEMSKPRSVAY